MTERVQLGLRRPHHPPFVSRELAASIGKNTLFGIVSNVAQVGTRIVTVPFVIAHLGLDGYGIWNIVVTISTYTRFGNVGAKTAFQKYVAEATATGQYEDASKLLSTGSALLSFISAIILILIIQCNRAITIYAGIPAGFRTETSRAILLLTATIGLANLGAAFEAVVSGGHRLDLIHKFKTAATVVEGVAIISLLHYGYGLFAMSVVMSASELLYICSCFMMSRRVVPEIRVRVWHVSKAAMFEVLRFAGSYQVVNLLEVVYVSLLPLTILRFFGPSATGAYAVVTRVTSAAAMFQQALLPAILSGSALVFASGPSERMQALLLKAFRATLALSLVPLGLVAVFGSTVVRAWAGQNDALFRLGFPLVALQTVLASLSLLALVLYRSSGRALLDTLRQVLRVLIVLSTLAFAKQLGFYGLLGGTIAAEFSGLLLMLYALAQTFQPFQVKSLLPDLGRFATATVVILGAGAAAGTLPLPAGLDVRLSAVLRLAQIATGCLLVAWPVAVRTGCITVAERGALLSAIPGLRRLKGNWLVKKVRTYE